MPEGTIYKLVILITDTEFKSGGQTICLFEKRYFVDTVGLNADMILRYIKYGDNPFVFQESISAAPF
jgi:hypothetical protein